jgi:glycine cleavage system regulatory protein
LRQGLVITFIADDKPGVIEQLSHTVAEHGGNWLESRLSHLAGKFAGIVRVSVAREHAAELQKQLLEFAEQGFTIMLESSDQPHNKTSSDIKTLSVFGLDRPGIVKEISKALASKGINVIEMVSDLSSAPMTGEPLFQAEVKFQAPSAESFDEVLDQLDLIAGQLALDISVDD